MHINIFQDISSLIINDIRFMLYLGYSEDERKERQEVKIDLEICFYNMPNSAFNDDLSDSICYAHLINIVKNNITSKYFKTIENLAYIITNIICDALISHKDNVKYIKISASKFCSQIEKIKGAVSFSILRNF